MTARTCECICHHEEKQASIQFRQTVGKGFGLRQVSVEGTDADNGEGNSWIPVGIKSWLMD
jgi:hypothetical protein